MAAQCPWCACLWQPAVPRQRVRQPLLASPGITWLYRLQHRTAGSPDIAARKAASVTVRSARHSAPANQPGASRGDLPAGRSSCPGDVELWRRQRPCRIGFSGVDLRPAKMSQSKSFLQDLDEAISRGTPESRSRALWHATDLLIAGRYSDDEIWTFGEVIGRLADEIEVAARAQLARRLARTDNAPHQIINKLAFDDSIEVAGPVLRESARLDAKTLVANARTKGQPHLLAISKRKSLENAVTDVLVTRGNREVVNSVANNNGARFSGFGFLHMIKRAEGDSILAEQLGLRKDIPRHLFQQLIAKASDDVRKRLERERPEMIGQIQTSVTDVTGALHSKFGPASKS